MLFSSRCFSLAAVSVLALTLSACTFTKEDPARQREADMAAVADRSSSAMAPAQGMRLTPLFDEPVKGSSKRIERLEQAVQALRDDLDVFAPAVEERLDVVETGMSDIAARQGAIKAETERLAAEAQKPVGNVQGVRIGDHLDKTRIVLDLSAEPEASTKLERNNTRLVVDLPRMTWSAPAAWSASGGALVSGWKYEDGKLVVDLLGPSTIKQQSLIGGDGKGVKHRLVIDLFSRGIHQ